MNDRPKIRSSCEQIRTIRTGLLYWNNQERPTKIVRRWFDFDDAPDGYWWYKVTGDEQLYPEAALEPRSGSDRP